MPDIRRAAKLFHQARNLDSEQRAAFIAQQCDGDPDLRREVESLLRAGDQPLALTQMLDASVGRGVASIALELGDDALSRAAQEAETRRYPRNIGRFEIVGVIARGGMGTVYEARQQAPSRTVALKVLARELASESARRRFEYEAELLAGLRHPGVAQVYEAGVWDDADEPVPYFAMEFVPGAMPLTQFAEREDLPLRRRLELFADACDAVHHGHQRGVIHRDLKPANILVDESGAVKVIDFGVARSLESTDHAFTRTGQLIGTLQYMSPEQCDGRAADVDARSDVYALGVILYELIVGELPYQVGAFSVTEAARIICDHQPTRPSTTTAGLRGEIDWIALKALEKQPQRRYQSAHELAGDVRAYLCGNSVSARPPTLLYQARVFARRHRAVTASVMVGAITLAIGAAGAAAGLVQADHHRQLEQKALANAVESRNTLRELYIAINPATGRGRSEALRTLDGAIAWYQQADFDGQPGLQAAVLAEIGRAELTLGLYLPASHTLLEALAIAEGALPPDDLRIAEILDGLGAALLHSMVPGPSTETLWRRALDIYQANYHQQSPEVAHAKYQLALTILFSEEGERLLHEALQAQQAALGPDHPETLATLTRLAWRHMDLGASDQAEPLFRSALEAQRRSLGGDHPDVANTVLSLGEMLNWYDRHLEAEHLLGEGLAIRRALFGPDHPATAEAERLFAGVLDSKGELEPAAVMLENAATVLAEHYPPRHNSLFWTRRALGRVLTRLARYDEAVRWLMLAVEDQQTLDGNPTHNAGWGRASLAEVYWSMGRQAEAVDHMRRAIEIMLNTGEPNNRRLKRAQATLEGWLAAPP